MTRTLGRIILISILGALLLIPLAARADETLSPEALSIANQLNCPVCEGLSVRDSTSQLSGQMRQEIQKRLDQGQSRQQIINYFVSVYGVSILRDPPKHGFILTLWWGPVVGLLVAIILLGAFLMQKHMRAARRGPYTDGVSATYTEDSRDHDLERYAARFRRELDENDIMDGGTGGRADRVESASDGKDVDVDIDVRTQSR